MGGISPREILVDGHMGLDGNIGSMEGRDNSVECDDSQRGVTHPRDMMFRTSGPWSSYKSKGAQPKEGIESLGKEIWRTNRGKSKVTNLTKVANMEDK
jgi:hypothetical protein